MSLKMLLLTSLCVLAVTQMSSSASIDAIVDAIQAQYDVNRYRWPRREQLPIPIPPPNPLHSHSELLTVLSQLQEDVADIKEILLYHHHGPEEGPINTPPEPESTKGPTTTSDSEPTATAEPKPGELRQQTGSAVAVLCWGQGAQAPPKNLAQSPQIFRVITVHKLLNAGQLDTVVLLVASQSQMMRGAPKYFFL